MPLTPAVQEALDYLKAAEAQVNILRENTAGSSHTHRSRSIRRNRGDRAEGADGNNQNRESHQNAQSDQDRDHNYQRRAGNDRRGRGGNQEVEQRRGRDLRNHLDDRYHARYGTPAPRLSPSAYVKSSGQEILGLAS